MRNLNFYGALALSTLSGCLWFLAVTPFDFSALAWIAAVPMFVAIERAGQRLINPGPDEVLRPGDRVLLLGHADQLPGARDLLAATE